ACSRILLDGFPRICVTTLERPFSPSSSAITRRPLSEAMKFTVLTRLSRLMASRKCLRNKEPLAPVVATVRFSGADKGKKFSSEAKRSQHEHRDGPDAKSRKSGRGAGDQRREKHV